ncbi:MAG: hypothetical protein NT031_20545, partial [Planctomycetota bacterium]|nr:hypothetical protein [Planctomycetota bacterium]
MELTELVDSQELSGGIYTLKYTATGSADPTEVYDAAMLQTAGNFAGRVRDPDMSISPVFVDTVRGVGRWDVGVRYSFQPRKMPLDTQAIRVDTTGGTQHITQAKLQRAVYPPIGSGSPDFKGAINVTDKAVEGVDIVVPQFNFTVDKCFSLEARAFLGWNGLGAIPRLSDLYELTGTINDADFTVTDSFTGMSITLAARECLFLGACKRRSKTVALGGRMKNVALLDQDSRSFGRGGIGHPRRRESDRSVYGHGITNRRSTSGAGGRDIQAGGVPAV